jgi:hypothetical protein
MDVIESVNATMATRSLDIAVDDLKDLLDDNNFPPDDPDPERHHKICSCTRIVHTIVWRDREPAVTVRKDVIPLLEAAEDKIDELKMRADLSKEKELALNLTHYMKNVRLRKENLETRYLKGLSTNFAWDEIEPRLKMMSSQESGKEKPGG